MPVIATISIPIGDTRQINLTITKPDATPLDLTGASLQFGVKTNLSDTAFQIQKTTGNGGVTITSATGGLATVTLNAADTIGMVAGAYYFDVLVTGTGGVKSTVTTGTLTLSDHPSR